jgi:hypothetical protein
MRDGTQTATRRERMVLADGLQPFLFRSRRGTIFLQAQLSTPLGYVKTKEHYTVGNYPCGNVLSRAQVRVG